VHHGLTVTETWAIDSYAGAVGTENQWKPYYKKKLRRGDVVGCALDLVAGTIKFSINGEVLGVAFSDLDVTKKYLPALSLKYNKTRVVGHFNTEEMKVPLGDAFPLLELCFLPLLLLSPPFRLLKRFSPACPKSAFNLI
jgi:hypothetical protein